jgi:hypothetical protein
MAISNGYATLAEVKAAARITDSIDDSLLEMSIEAASRQIDGYCGRNFFVAGTVATDRYFVAANNAFIWVDDFATTTGLVIACADNLDGNYSNTWSTSDYQLEPLNNVSDGIAWPYTRIRSTGNKMFPTGGYQGYGGYNVYGGYGNYGGVPSYGGQIAGVKITAKWGWPTVPASVRQAAILLTSRLFKRFDSPLGVAGFGDLGAIRVSRVDPDVAASLEPFVLRRNIA